MTNALNLVAPQWACPADWFTATVDLGDPSLPTIQRTGTYLADQPTLDAVVAQAQSTGAAVIYLKLPPMGFSDTRMANPNAFYPTPALTQELVSRAEGAATAAAASAAATATKWLAHQSGHNYVADDIVVHTDGSWLICITPHTSGSVIDLSKFEPVVVHPSTQNQVALSATYVSVGQSKVDVSGKYGGDIAAAITAEGHGKHFLISSPISNPAPFTLAAHDVLEGTPSAAVTLNADQTTITIAPGAEAPTVSGLLLINNFTGVRTTYDVVCTNPYEPKFENLELKLSQSATAMGGIHVAYDAGQAGTSQSFLVRMNDVRLRNGLLTIDANVTDGKVSNSWFWATYTAAAAAVTLNGSNWTFDNVDVVPPQGDAAGYLINGCNNVSIIGGLIDGSYDTIMTGHGIRSTTGAVRGLSVVGAKFYNLGRSGLKLYDVRRSSFIGNVFVQGNKADNFYADIDLASCNGNVVVANTHGAPVARTNKAKIYVEDSASGDNLVSANALEINSSIVPNGHYYDTAMFSVQSSTLVRDNRPAANWPTSTLLAKSTNYSIVKEDLYNGRNVLVSGGATMTLPSAASVHAGDRVTIKNTSTTQDATIATTGGQTIDGLSSLTLAVGRSVTVTTDAANWQIVSSRAVSPSLAIPPLSMLATVSATAWPSANMAIFQRFTVPEGRPYRYVNLRLDTSSGNYQVGVVRLSGAGLTTYTRVMDSGVVAAPVAGDLKVDLGATTLPAGDYAVFAWSSNTTLATRVASNSGIPSMRQSAELSSLTSGVASSGTLAWTSSRFLGGISVEADV